MESIKGDPAAQNAIRDLRSILERLQEKVKVLEDKVRALESVGP
jgi:hypothetical protein